MIRQNGIKTALAMAFVAGGLTMVSLQTARAEDMSAQQILDGLKVSKTRSLTTADRPAMTTEDQAFIDRVRGKNRSLTLNEREQMAELAPKRPKVDLEINFDYNSAALTPKTEPQLDNLGKALTSSELTGSVIMLGGHTDAKGSDQYNQSLSERRAETVKKFLVEKYKISAKNLISAGYGKKGLKNPDDAFAPENRRVEIVNVAESKEASR